MDEAADVAVSTTLEFLLNEELPHSVTFVLFSAQDHAIYEGRLAATRAG